MRKPMGHQPTSFTRQYRIPHAFAHTHTCACR